MKTVKRFLVLFIAFSVAQTTYAECINLNGKQYCESSNGSATTQTQQTQTVLLPPQQIVVVQSPPPCYGQWVWSDWYQHLICQPAAVYAPAYSQPVYYYPPTRDSGYYRSEDGSYLPWGIIIGYAIGRHNR